jgi:hypothetical protein
MSQEPNLSHVLSQKWTQNGESFHHGDNVDVNKLRLKFGFSLIEDWKKVLALLNN